MWSTWRKALGAEQRTNPNMMPIMGINPGLIGGSRVELLSPFNVHFVCIFLGKYTEADGYRM